MGGTISQDGAEGGVWKAADGSGGRSGEGRRRVRAPGGRGNQGPDRKSRRAPGCAVERDAKVRQKAWWGGQSCSPPYSTFNFASVPLMRISLAPLVSRIDRKSVVSGKSVD